MTDIRVRLLSVFRVEARDHLDMIRGATIPLAAGERSGAGFPIDEVFRRAHSLKGAARATGLRPIETLAHRLETLFARIKSGDRALDQPLATLVLTVADAIEDWLAAYDGDQEPPAPEEALRLLDDALGASAGTSAEATAPPAPAPGQTPEAPGDDGMLRIHASDLDRLLRSAERLQAEAQRYHLLAPPLRSIEDGLSELDREWKKLVNQLSALRADLGEATVPAGLGRRIDAVSRALRTVGAEARGTRLRHRRTAWTLGRICDELHAGIRRVRMVPASDVFGGFRKMMRDLARDVGKEIAFQLRGADVEADRAVLQSLKDPVMHLLRNAAFHGIEETAVRRDRGKPAAGRVVLGFERQGSHLAVRVEDDGAGIDSMKVSEKAVRAGLLTPAAAAAAAEEDDVVRLIFQPGFSTADEVGEIAGRGMGLSVAYETVRRLNGALEVLPRDGGGTVFHITVPLSVSAQRLVMVSARGETYGIPASSVARLLRIRKADVSSIEGASAVALDGRHIHLRSLAGLLGGDDPVVSSHDGEFEVVVVRWGEAIVGLAVDRLEAMSDAVIKDVGFPLPDHSKVGGAVFLEDGTVALVLNPYQLVRDFVTRAVAAPLVTESDGDTASIPVILVVDDSMTTRTLEKSILEAHGYRVRIAVDGLDALLQLRANPVDLVVADVEMPRIDGFSLLKELKRDPALSHIPVILVTSLQRREDLERGFTLGAEAYLLKQKFDQGELLETIRQVL